jgi:REP element-mobilizing transposase RayT
MARQLRIQFAGAVYHIMSRGNARQNVFLDDRDRRSFLEELWRVSDRNDWLVWAYCLMPNHYHLLVETRRPTLAVGMRDLNGRYSLEFNRRHDRVGHLLQGRYRALLVDRESYLLEVARYILLNPVRARLCASVGDWRWNSYRDVMGLRGAAAPRLAVRALLDYFDPRLEGARAKFARFVHAGAGVEAPPAHVRNQLVMGGDEFVAEVARFVGSPASEVPRTERATQSLAEYVRRAAGRDDAIRCAYASGMYSQVEIARYFGLHYTTVCRILKRVSRQEGDAGPNAKIQDVTP